VSPQCLQLLKNYGHEQNIRLHFLGIPGEWKSGGSQLVCLLFTAGAKLRNFVAHSKLVLFNSLAVKKGAQLMGILICLLGLPTGEKNCPRV
jgi:hypothetical protein